MEIINQFPKTAKRLTIDKIKLLTLEQLLKIQAKLSTDLFHNVSATKI